jgi:hypothetical protein
MQSQKQSKKSTKKKIYIKSKKRMEMNNRYKNKISANNLAITKAHKRKKTVLILTVLQYCDEYGLCWTTR